MTRLTEISASDRSGRDVECRLMLAAGPLHSERIISNPWAGTKKRSFQAAAKKKCSTAKFACLQIRAGALALAEELIPRWLPHGRRMGSEWVALNPTRADRRLGSFKVNLRTGRWADFATGDAGGDPGPFVPLVPQLHEPSPVLVAISY